MLGDRPPAMVNLKIVRDCAQCRTLFKIANTEMAKDPEKKNAVSNISNVKPHNCHACGQVDTKLS